MPCGVPLQVHCTTQMRLFSCRYEVVCEARDLAALPHGQLPKTVLSAFWLALCY